MRTRFTCALPLIGNISNMLVLVLLFCVSCIKVSGYWNRVGGAVAVLRHFDPFFPLQVPCLLSSNRYIYWTCSTLNCKHSHKIWFADAHFCLEHVCKNQKKIQFVSMLAPWIANIQSWKLHLQRRLEMRYRSSARNRRHRAFLRTLLRRECR